MIIDIEEVILIKNIAIFSTSRWFLFNIVQHVLATIKIITHDISTQTEKVLEMRCSQCY